jgi:hypothetical protein
METVNPKKRKSPHKRDLFFLVFTVINPIAGELLSSRAHVLFEFTEQM